MFSESDVINILKATKDGDGCGMLQVNRLFNNRSECYDRVCKGQLAGLVIVHFKGTLGFYNNLFCY